MQGSQGKFKRPTPEQTLLALKGTSEDGATNKEVFDILEKYPAFIPISLPGPSDWLAAHPEPGQGFTSYTTNEETNLVTPSRHSIYIVPLESSITPSFLSLLTRFCLAFFPQTLTKTDRPFSLDDSQTQQKVQSRTNPHSKKKQYHGRDLLTYMHTFLPDDAYCYMGCMHTDLYPDDKWNYVFGLACRVNRIGAFSFARFSNSFFDPKIKEDAESLEYRALKVMVHEIGHTFNLEHCIYHECGMNGINNADELVAKPLEFCAVCLKKLQWNLKFDVVARFEALAKVCLESENRYLKQLGDEYQQKIQYLAKHNITAGQTGK